MNFQLLLLILILGLTIRISEAETENDSNSNEVIKAKRLSDGEEDVKPRKQKKLQIADREDGSSDQIIAKKPSEKSHINGNHTKKYRPKDSEDNEVQITSESNLKDPSKLKSKELASITSDKSTSSTKISNESAPIPSEKVVNSKKTNDESRAAVDESTKEKKSKVENQLSIESQKNVDAATEKREKPIESSSISAPKANLDQGSQILEAKNGPPKGSLELPAPSPTVSDLTRSQQSSEDSESFSMLYYFSGVLFLVLSVFAYFVYRFLFKPPVPSARSAAAAAAGTTAYTKLPQSDLEMSLSSKPSEPKEESDWEEWEGEGHRAKEAVKPTPTYAPQSSFIREESAPTTTNFSSLSSSSSAFGTSRSGSSPGFQPTKTARQRSPPVPASTNADLFASIGISAAPKFQAPVTKPKTSPPTASRGGGGRFESGTSRVVSRVSSLGYEEDGGRWGEDKELDGLIDSD